MLNENVYYNSKRKWTVEPTFRFSINSDQFRRPICSFMGSNELKRTLNFIVASREMLELIVSESIDPLSKYFQFWSKLVKMGQNNFYFRVGVKIRIEKKTELNGYSVKITISQSILIEIGQNRSKFVKIISIFKLMSKFELNKAESNGLNVKMTIFTTSLDEFANWGSEHAAKTMLWSSMSIQQQNFQLIWLVRNEAMSVWGHLSFSRSHSLSLCLFFYSKREGL